MNWLNYHHLMYFRCIAIEGSIAKASEKLYVGQPALSAQLKALEESFEQQLFERKNRKLILTDAGKFALKYANQIYEMATELSEAMSDKKFTAKQSLNIGALDSIPKNLILQMIKDAQKLQPCSVRIYEAQGDELYRNLEAHQLDLIISNYSLGLSDQKNLFSRSIGKVAIHIYGGDKFKHLKKNFPQSLDKAPFLLPTKHSKLRHDIDHFFELQEIQPQIYTECQDSSLLKQMAIEGLGLIALPDFAVDTIVQAKKLHNLGTLPAVEEEYWLISSSRFIESPISSAIMESFQLKKTKNKK